MTPEEKELIEQLISRVAFLEDKVKHLTKIIEEDCLSKELYMNMIGSCCCELDRSRANEILFNNKTKL